MRGKDYFVEEELMKYLDGVDIDQLREQQRLKQRSSGEPRSSAAALLDANVPPTLEGGPDAAPAQATTASATPNNMNDANVLSTQEDCSDTRRAIPVPATPASSNSHTQTRRNLNNDFADANGT
ncbi:hypothetical protein PInf_004353 [Phytophthora infestans]|nr:hypothetical protein PInf_004353 [Phytophthora infestans]